MKPLFDEMQAEFAGALAEVRRSGQESFYEFYHRMSFFAPRELKSHYFTMEKFFRCRQETNRVRDHYQQRAKLPEAADATEQEDLAEIVDVDNNVSVLEGEISKESY